MNIQNVINLFTEPYQLDPNVVGIVLVGSYVNSVPNRYSDIDLHIVLEDADWRERENIFIDGIEVEYFINPLLQLYHYMETEDVYTPHTVHMLATGIILYEQKGSNHLKKVISEAKRRKTETLPEFSEIEIENAKYGLDDILKDAMDVYELNPVSYYLISSSLVNYCIELFFKLNQRIIPKSKRRHLIISKLDPILAQLLNVYVSSTTIESLQNIVSRIEQLLGGKRSDTWKLLGGVTY